MVVGRRPVSIAARRFASHFTASLGGELAGAEISLRPDADADAGLLPWHVRIATAGAAEICGL